MRARPMIESAAPPTADRVAGQTERLRAVALS
jgi:hypothetical protein